MNDRVREILGWYGADNPGTLANLARLLDAGKLGGTGRLLILPVDQGFEHGPGRSFAPNPAAYDPRYHFRLAIESGCSAFAAPLGLLEAGAREHAGDIPLILKLNSHDSLAEETDPNQAVYGSVEDALQLGCCGVGYTIYPGSTHRLEMYDRLRDLAREAKQRGLLVVVWSYPRGGGLAKDDETAIDVIAYAAHIAAELGAHIIKVKLPSSRLAQPEARAVYESRKVPVGTLVERVRHVIQAAFAGRRIVLFSGGATKANDDDVLTEVRAIRDGGGFGSIIGRNSFQRPEPEARRLLDGIVKILADAPPAGQA
jgi:class I fructose-bisphosphate aldolase